MTTSRTTPTCTTATTTNHGTTRSTRRWEDIPWQNTIWNDPGFLREYFAERNLAVAFFTEVPMERRKAADRILKRIVALTGLSEKRVRRDLIADYEAKH